MKILFVGPQGSGKSTQAKLLSGFLHLPAISTGDIFRELSVQDSKLGRLVKEVLRAGRLVDDKTTAEIVKQKLKQPDYRSGFIFDGYPRTLKQIEYFDPGFDRAFYLKFDDEFAKARLLSRGRSDDTLKLIEERLHLYHELTDPILSYYQNLGILQTIDAAQSIEEIQQQIRGKLNGQT